jgi:hypothetical protein
VLQFQLEPNDGFLLARLSGLVSAEAWQKALEALERALQDMPGDRLVIDMGGVVGWLGEPERRAVGTLMARHLARMKRVALVVEARKVTGVVEQEARRGGLDLCLFPVHEDAVNWVLG